jgi:hypothetical protein
MMWADKVRGAGDSESDEEDAKADGGDGGHATFTTVDDVRTKAPATAKFEILSDSSTALLLQPGQRLKVRHHTAIKRTALRRWLESALAMTRRP